MKHIAFFKDREMIVDEHSIWIKFSIKQNNQSMLNGTFLIDMSVSIDKAQSGRGTRFSDNVELFHIFCRISILKLIKWREIKCNGLFT